MTSVVKRVLVVEDNPENLYLATLLLEGAGYEVTGASSGADALVAATQGPYEFVVLDLQLPDMDGIEVANRFRAIVQRDTPIIMVSASAASHDRRLAQAAGCRGYLEKPIVADCFVEQLRCMAGVRS